VTVTRILLADDHAVVRHGLRLVLDAEPDLEVVAEAGDGAEAVALGLAHEIDLAGARRHDAAPDGHPGGASARRAAPRPGHPDPVDARQRAVLLRGPARGRVGIRPEVAAHDDLVAACRAAMRGEPFLYPRGVAALVRDYLQGVIRVPEDPLTPRETEIVKLIAEGLTSREIGEVLHIADKTVERHRSNVLEKLGLKDRVALTRYAIRRGLVEP
jgi:DNA-binding NarL/FixJ family response regulator